ncbi:MAG TPA: adenylate/guanylate cyclase domain-containing protein [Gaiellaceae bacterium]|nr:adenylate/guanylate cyclase domain-containing protein [Gaiellaceae bacterium]
MRAGSWIGIALAVAAAPLLLLAALRARPALDVSWENRPAHFWLVLGAAALATAIGYGVHVAARRRRDARLLLISLAFVASTGFLGLHALATPGVLLGGPNAGFELATPVGLVVAGVFVAAAAIELRPRRAEAVVSRSRTLLGGLVALMAAWAVLSLAELPPLDNPLAAEQLDGWQLVLAALGVGLYGVAALGFVRLYRRRPERFVFAFAISFVLLAEAMVVIAWARNWQLSWWEWHVLMLGAFVVIGAAARSEWHEERFSALYLEETLAGAKDVSVLFADLAGFTSFSERHDPAEVASMLNAYFEAIVPLMEAAGGEVHQIVGDELMVIFGKEGAAPDHPARAARAALLLQRTAEEVARDHEGWPRFRVGVNSGEVHVGVVGAARGHRKHGIVGDVVNLTARLQAEAPIGFVLIGDGTFRRLGAHAVVEPLPPRKVKGKAEPVAAYLLHSLDGEGDAAP